MKTQVLFLLSLAVSGGLMAQVGWTDATAMLNGSIQGTHATGVVDVNGDGLDDIVGLEDGNYLFVWMQDSNGDFSKWEVGAIGEEGSGWSSDDAWGMCWADVDNNGYCDLIAGGAYDGLKVCLMNDTGDGFDITDAENVDIFLQGVNLFDANYDGFADIFACHDDGASHLILNDGNGGFSYDADAVASWWDMPGLYGAGEQGSGNYGSVFCDVNNDGYADMYIAKCRQGVTNQNDNRRINQLWMYDPLTGIYTEDAMARGLADGAQSWSADFGDVDNDGDMDCFIGNHDQPCRLMINDGTGFFTDIASDAGLGAGAFPFAVIESIMRDFDNDGWIDILVTGSGDYVIAYNNGDNTFDLDDSSFDYEINSFGLGDLNNDGFVDIYATAGGYGGSGGGSQPMDMLLMNDGNDNHWIKVDLQGTESTVDGLGAIVVIEGPFGQQRREVRSGESYGIMNSMIVHFGLGSEDFISDVWVYWPSGIVDHLTTIDADFTLDIIEGQAVGIQEQTAATAINVYPNPTTDFIAVDLSQVDGKVILRVIDEQGRVALSQSTQGQQQASLDVSGLAKGNYILTVQKDKQQIHQGSFVVR
jgi:hypothetical protein